MKTVLKIYRIIFGVIAGSVKLFVKLWHISDFDFNTFMERSYAYAMEKRTDYFVSVRIRPKKTSELPDEVRRSDYSEYALIIQGPLCTANDFTLETAKYYEHQYPGIKLIVSTWEGEDEKTISELRRGGIVVIQGRLPSRPGRLNINYQVVSTQAGLKFAKDANVKYVCKTRTDQRIYQQNAIEYMRGLVELFPVNNSDFRTPQKKRILCVGMEGGDLFSPYAVCDFLFFGSIDDIENLFSLPMDGGDVGKWDTQFTALDSARQERSPEVKLIRSYIRNSGGDDTCSVKCYWEFVRNHLVCINKDDIGLYWYKYERRYSEHMRNGTYFPKERLKGYPLYSFDFIRWLNLYTGTMEYHREYEEYLQLIRN